MGVKMPEITQQGFSSSKQKTRKVMQNLGSFNDDTEPAIEEKVQEIEVEKGSNPPVKQKKKTIIKKPKEKLTVTIDKDINDFLDSLTAESRHNNKSLIVNDILGDYMDNYLKER